MGQKTAAFDVKAIQKNILKIKHEVYNNARAICKWHGPLRASDILKLKNSYEKLRNNIETAKHLFENQMCIDKSILKMIDFLEFQINFWRKYPNFGYEDYVNYISACRSNDLYFLEPVKESSNWECWNGKLLYYSDCYIELQIPFYWNIFYYDTEDTKDDRVRLCSKAMMQNCLKQLVAILSAEVAKQKEDRTPLNKIINKFIKDLPNKELCSNWKYEYISVISELKRLLAAYNNKSLKVLAKTVDTMDEVQNHMYLYLLPPGFDKGKVGKAKTTDDIGKKQQTKEKRKSCIF